MKKHTCIIGLILIGFLFHCGRNAEEKALNQFIDLHTSKVKPMIKAANLAYWGAAVTGEDSLYLEYSRLELKIRKVYSDSSDYQFLKEIKASGQIKDPLLIRQMDKLHNKYLENQIEPELLEKIVTLGAEIEKKFSTFRATVDGKPVTSNQINQILKVERNPKNRKNAWLASKQVGPIVSEDIIRLVKLRNEAAKNLGFNNYHDMMLALGEQDVDEINQMFDELYGFTAGPFEALKSELDEILAARYHVEKDQLKPWHYHDSFFQETPLVYNIDLDAYYQDKDIEALSAEFYRGLGLPVEDILQHSDLYEKQGKNPHAFCTDIDKEGDIRILCNINPTERWMETMLHELGHAVYDKYQDPGIPYLLREPAHTFTTEAIAMMFGRLSRDGAWMQVMLNLTDDQRKEIEEVSEKYARLKQLIFARWAMVMFKFEQELYADPDQDLNALWWDLKAKYQLLEKPEGRNEPDWASKIHFAIAPCYYHNYLLGELLASQLYNQIANDVLQNDAEATGFVNQTAVGDFLKSRVFEAGAVYPWNELIERATGEPLNPKYFVEQFVK